MGVRSVLLCGHRVRAGIPVWSVLDGFWRCSKNVKLVRLNDERTYAGLGVSMPDGNDSSLVQVWSHDVAWRLTVQNGHCSMAADAQGAPSYHLAEPFTPRASRLTSHLAVK